MILEGLIPLIALLICAIPFTAVGVPLARAIARRIDRQTVQPRILSDVSARLERLEQGMDAIAIEIERMSEGQRFVTKLLAEKHEVAHRLTRSSETPG